MKTPQEEIKYLAQMLSCTTPNDTKRLNAIIARVREINADEIVRDLEMVRDAYQNMRDFAEANGLNTATGNRPPENV